MQVQRDGFKEVLNESIIHILNICAYCYFEMSTIDAFNGFKWFCFSHKYVKYN